MPTATNASWLRSPQRVWLRRGIFQIHLWVGVALSIYCVVIGLSGGALVFEPEIDDWLHPNTVHLLAGSGAINMAGAVRQIEADRPGWRGIGLENLDKPDRATILFMGEVKPGTKSDSRLVSFNPHTGQVLVDRMRYQGALGWVTNLHYYLLAGETGLLVSGWMAAGLLLLCTSGLVLWWPGVRRWASSLVLRRRARWQRLNWDLHVVVGFWCCAVLGLVALTGVYFAFPNPVRASIVAVTGGGVRAAKPRPKSPSPKGTAVMTIDEVIASARRALPASAPPAYLFMPDLSGGAQTPYGATGYYAGTAPFSQLVQVSINGYSGAVLSLTDTRNASLGERIIQYFFAIHFGWFGGAGLLGVVVKVVWVLLGVSPAMLAVTGLIMYWNRKLRPLLKTRFSAH